MSEQKIEDRLSKLNQDFHQKTSDRYITAEIIDITAGFEVLMGRGERFKCLVVERVHKRDRTFYIWDYDFKISSTRHSAPP